MKRTGFHLLFWLCYWLFTAYIEYLWVQQYIPGWSAAKEMQRALAASFSFGLLPVALAYYISYVVLPRIVQKKHGLPVILLYILLPCLAEICGIILMARHWVLPVIYEGYVKPRIAFFDPLKFWSIIIEAAFPAALLMAFRFVETQLHAREREKNLIQEKLTTELQLLKSQLNPHFLFNTLNNIYALSRRKSDATPEMVLRLSEMLSFMLYEAGHETIAIEKEIKFLEDYISIQQMRYTDGLKIDFKKEIDNPHTPITPLLLLPLVENAFKHGASENHFDSFIHIQLTVKEANLTFSIENSFEEQGAADTKKTIGLNNTTRRLELLYQQYSLEIGNTPPVFTVKLMINLDTYGKV